MRFHPPRRRAGFTLVELLVVLTVIVLLVGLIAPAAQMVRESGRRTKCASNMRQIGIGVYTYHESRRQLPTSNRAPLVATGPRLSWATQLLPYLEQQNMYDEYDCKKNWSNKDAPVAPRTMSNNQLSHVRVEVFECPSTPDLAELDGDVQYWTEGFASWSDSRCAALTSYSPIVQVEARLYSFLGVAPPPDATGMMPRNMAANFDHVRDGLTNTILLAESAGRPFVYRRGAGRIGDLSTNRVNGGGWVRPASDFALDGTSRDGTTFPGPCAINCANGEDYVNGGNDQSAVPIPFYGTFGTGETYSFHSGGANTVFGDGSVHFIDETIAIKVYAQLVTRRGSEVIEVKID